MHEMFDENYTITELINPKLHGVILLAFLSILTVYMTFLLTLLTLPTLSRE